MKKLNQKGFSLIEMVLVLILLAILTVSAAPSITSIVSNANNTQADYVVSQVRSGLKIYWANEALQNDGAGSYPSTLGASCCFGDVLDDPITHGWSKSGNVYTHDLSSQTFTYTSANGTFE